MFLLQFLKRIMTYILQLGFQSNSMVHSMGTLVIREDSDKETQCPCLSQGISYKGLESCYAGFCPGCYKLKLCSLSFADDLLLFSRACVVIVKCMMEALTHFSRHSGLGANPDKTQIVIARIPIQEERLMLLLEVTGFQREDYHSNI